MSEPTAANANAASGHEPRDEGENKPPIIVSQLKESAIVNILRDIETTAPAGRGGFYTALALLIVDDRLVNISKGLDTLASSVRGAANKVRR